MKGRPQPSEEQGPATSLMCTFGAGAAVVAAAVLAAGASVLETSREGLLQRACSSVQPLQTGHSFSTFSKATEQASGCQRKLAVHCTRILQVTDWPASVHSTSQPCIRPGAAPGVGAPVVVAALTGKVVPGAGGAAQGEAGRVEDRGQPRPSRLQHHSILSRGHFVFH
mmetsp:Transcript_59777/g.185300  ORF Transcript_59777/g.185300 Transcript_59777/m.185300 type:complete len:168 (+) Transcript_59777:254-757(+)